MNKLTYPLPDLAATEQLAIAVAELLRPLQHPRGLTIALSGTLGAGKTQWVRYFCEALGVPSEQVTSPTYVLLQRYTGLQTIYHFDFYRLQSESQVWDLGIDELFEQPVLIVIEWAEKFASCLPDDHLSISLAQASASLRIATLASTGPAAQAVLQGLSKN